MSSAALPPFIINDWYWVVNNSTTSVYSSATGTTVSNTAAAYLAWLSGRNCGASFDILSAANNGSGLIRLTMTTTAFLRTGQQWRVEDDNTTNDGNFAITVIDATHADLVASTFGATFTGRLQGATLIPSAADLATVLNNAAIFTATPAASTPPNSAVDVTLTNPLPFLTRLTFTASAKKAILPVMNAPTSIPIGQPFRIKNLSPTIPFNVVAQDGSTIIATVRTSDELQFTLLTNTTANGTFAVAPISATASFTVNGVAVTTSGGTTAAVAFEEGTGRDSAGIPRFLKNGSFTIDAATAGPVANGRDQAAAFTASQQLTLYAIAKEDGTINGLVSSINANSTLGPSLPTDYVYWVPLCGVYWTAGSIFESISIGRNSIRLGTATAAQNVRGFTLQNSSPNAFLVNDNSGGDPFWKPMGGDATLAAATGNVTIAADAVGNTKLANMAFGTVKGRVTAGTGDPEDIAAGQLPATATNDDATAGRIGEFMISGHGNATAQTCTISNATPAVVTAAAHTLSVGAAINFTTTGTLPAPLAVGTNYYVSSQNFAAGSFCLSTTSDNAIAGTSINTTTAGSGVHTLVKQMKLTTATNVDMAILNLTAGDWDLWGNVGFVAAATTNATRALSSINTVTGTLNVAAGFFGGVACPNAGLVGGTGWNALAGPVRVSINATTKYRLVLSPIFTVSTLSAYGTLQARRRR